MFKYADIYEIVVMILTFIIIGVTIKDIIKKEIGKVDLFFSTIICALLICMNFFYTINLVKGESMMPTIKDKQFVVSNKYTNEFNRFDIIIFKAPQIDKVLIKRIIATEGETIEIINGDIYINGDKIEENFGTIPLIENMGPIIVPEDSYFVLGDNRAGSMDSRYSSIGCVYKEYIKGKIVKY